MDPGAYFGRQAEFGMTENFGWSASIGRWLGIPVRVHLLLLLFVSAIIGIEMTFNGQTHVVGIGTGIVTVCLLLASIAIHELAHLFAIANLGGHVNTVVLMPWGGNSDYILPRSSRVRGAIFGAGPFVNGIIFALGATLLMRSGDATFTQLTNPFRPYEFVASNWEISIVQITTWLNFQLMLINLIPCYPFDGASLVRALIGSLNVDLPKSRSESAIMVLGHAVAFTMIGLSLMLQDYHPGPFDSAWILLTLCGITLIFAARYSYLIETAVENDEWNDGPIMGYDSEFAEPMQTTFDFSSGNGDSVYSQWLNEKQDERIQAESAREEDEDRRADEILKKLHYGGISSLSTEERMILDRVSARIRRRREQGV
jgi:hypothetical protein